MHTYGYPDVCLTTWHIVRIYNPHVWFLPKVCFQRPRCCRDGGCPGKLMGRFLLGDCWCWHSKVAMLIGNTIFYSRMVALPTIFRLKAKRILFEWTSPAPAASWSSNVSIKTFFVRKIQRIPCSSGLYSCSCTLAARKLVPESPSGRWWWWFLSLQQVPWICQWPCWLERNQDPAVSECSSFGVYFWLSHFWDVSLRLGISGQLQPPLAATRTYVSVSRIRCDRCAITGGSVGPARVGEDAIHRCHVRRRGFFGLEAGKENGHCRCFSCWFR